MQILDRWKTSTILLVLICFLTLVVSCNGDGKPKPVFKGGVYLAPLYRCPGVDLTVSYTTSPSSRVEIRIDGHVYQSDAPDSWSGTIPASEIDDLNDPEVTVKFKCKTGGNTVTKTVHTFFSPTLIARTALPEGSAPYDTFSDLLQPALWDDRIHVSEIRLNWPKEYTCPGETPSNKRHYWQFDRGPQASGVLDPSNDWTFTFAGNPIRAEGTWMYRTNASCVRKPPSVQSPSISYECLCK
jgi:hypothetical protein